jgi:hypothetical protein
MHQGAIAKMTDSLQVRQADRTYTKVTDSVKVQTFISGVHAQAQAAPVAYPVLLDTLHRRTRLGMRGLRWKARRNSVLSSLSLLATAMCTEAHRRSLCCRVASEESSTKRAWLLWVEDGKCSGALLKIKDMRCGGGCRAGFCVEVGLIATDLARHAVLD